jgi:hypothetical protein
MGVKMGQWLRERDGGRVAQLPFLTYLRPGGGARLLLSDTQITASEAQAPLGRSHK